MNPREAGCRAIILTTETAPCNNYIALTLPEHSSSISGNSKARTIWDESFSFSFPFYGSGTFPHVTRGLFMVMCGRGRDRWHPAKAFFYFPLLTHLFLAVIFQGCMMFIFPPLLSFLYSSSFWLHAYKYLYRITHSRDEPWSRLCVGFCRRL